MWALRAGGVCVCTWGNTEESSKWDVPDSAAWVEIPLYVDSGETCLRGIAATETNVG